jgi:single-strand DNA-binding protein
MANNVVISGALVNAPELHFTNSGSAVADFCVRVVTGQRKEGDEYAPSAFIDCAVWNSQNGGKAAENAAESLSKGDRVVVTGKLVSDTWEDKESGQKRTKLKVLAFEVSADLSYAVVKVAQNERSGGRQAPARSQNEPSF